MFCRRPNARDVATEHGAGENVPEDERDVHVAEMEDDQLASIFALDREETRAPLIDLLNFDCLPSPAFSFADQTTYRAGIGTSDDVRRGITSQVCEKGGFAQAHGGGTLFLEGFQKALGIFFRYIAQFDAVGFDGLDF